MSHHSKIIAMFAASINHKPTNAGSLLAFTVQAFFMPGHKVYLIWYPCTPAWSVNAPTAFVGCDRQRERHGYFHFKKLLLCLTMQKFPSPPTTASERPPTKRVLPPSPLPAILSPTLPPMALTCTDAPSATCAAQTPTATLSPGGSTSPGASSPPGPPLTRPLFSSWWRSMASIDAMWRNAISVSASAISRLGGLAIRNSRSPIATSLSCNRSHHPVNDCSFAQPAFMAGLCRNSTPYKSETLKNDKQ